MFNYHIYARNYKFLRQTNSSVEADKIYSMLKKINANPIVYATRIPSVRPV